MFCDNRLNSTRADGAPTFNFSDPNSVVYTHSSFGPVYGSGRVTHSGVGVLFEGEAYHGFGEGKCRLVPSGDSCGSSEVCVLKLSNPNQGSVADCRDGVNRPYENLFQHRICCEPSEVCNDGIDNTGDGLVDCASPDCHPSLSNSFTSRLCTPDSLFPPGNNQNTSECISHVAGDSAVYYPHCLNGASAFYCSYGPNDDGSQTSGEGYCCPAGQRAYFNVIQNKWICQSFEQCGVALDRPCFFDYRFGGSNLTSWLSSSFSVLGANWCNSHLPNLYNPVNDDYDSSSACCFVEHYGQVGFYYKSDNVKIFGYE